MRDNMRKVSIIIPTFNRANLVKRAIDSALNQTFPCEVILCDHGSSDNTPEVASNYNNKIKYIRREVDQGPIICWRDGLENSTGEIIHINYDDDWMEPTFIEKTLELLKEDVGFVYSRYLLHRQNKSNLIGNIHQSGINRMKDIVKFLLLTPLTISPGCAIFRRSDAIKNLLLEIPGASGKYGKNSGVGEDLLLFLLTSLDYPNYAHVSEPLVHFLAHSESITTNSIMSGHENELQDSYNNAKKYFLAQPKSLPLSSSWISQIYFKICWKLRAKTLMNDLFIIIKKWITKK